jgi:hypothetical protein
MSGEDRSWLHWLPMLTGPRRGESQTLRPKNFDLDAEQPTVFLGGQFTKNGKPAHQSLPSHEISWRRSRLASQPSHAPLFSAERNSSLMIKADPMPAGSPLDDHRNSPGIRPRS